MHQLLYGRTYPRFYCNEKPEEKKEESGGEESKGGQEEGSKYPNIHPKNSLWKKSILINCKRAMMQIPQHPFQKDLSERRGNNQLQKGKDANTPTLTSKKKEINQLQKGEGADTPTSI